MAKKKEPLNDDYRLLAQLCDNWGGIPPLLLAVSNMAQGAAQYCLDQVDETPNKKDRERAVFYHRRYLRLAETLENTARSFWDIPGTPADIEQKIHMSRRSQKQKPPERTGPSPPDPPASPKSSLIWTPGDR